MHPTTALLEEDWVKFLLALFHVENGTIRGSTKLQKEMFYLSRAIPRLFEEDIFGKHDYGPYSEELDDSLIEVLELEGLLDIEEGRETNLYILTAEGRKIAKKAFDALPENEKNVVLSTKSLFEDLTTEEIVFVVYILFPEMTDYSRLKKKLLLDKKNKLRLTRILYTKGKFSLDKLVVLTGFSAKEIIA